jgi:hypothetical protein
LRGDGKRGGAELLVHVGSLARCRMSRNGCAVHCYPLRLMACTASSSACRKRERSARVKLAL